MSADRTESTAAIQPSDAEQRTGLTTIDPPARLAAVAALLALVAGILVAASVIKAPRLSALDEATHLDYAWQVAHGSIPRSGDLLSGYTLRIWSCHGQPNLSATDLPACNSAAPPASYPAQGINYNTFHPPLYYALTGALAGLTSPVGADFFTAARLLGALWLFAGMLALYLTLRYWAVGTLYALPAALALASIPVLLHASSIVTNDAPAALCGAGALFVVGRALRNDRTGALLPAALAALAAATKTLNALGFLAAALVLMVLGAVRWRRYGIRAGRPLLVIGVAMGAAVLAVFGGWYLIQRLRSGQSYVSPVAGVNTRPIRGNPLGEWLGTEFTGFGIGRTYYLDPAVDGVLLAIWVTVLAVLSSAAGFMALAASERPANATRADGTRADETRASPAIPAGRAVGSAGAVALVGTLLYPAMVQGQAWLSSGGREFFPVISTRYGISLLPIIVGCLALTASGRGWWRTSALVAGCGLAAILITTF